MAYAPRRLAQRMQAAQRMPSSPFLFLALTASATPLLVAACGGSTASGGTRDAGGSGLDATANDAHAGDSSGGTNPIPEGGGSSEAGANACAIPAPGATFTFHVHNSGTSHLGLSYGCGGTLPIQLNTPGGPLGIGPGPADACEFTCQQQYMGPVQQGCSDCGPGVGADLAAGTTVDITWDCRVYVAHTASPECVGGQPGVSCALAETVAPSAMQMGTLSVCTGGASSGGPGGGSCSGSEIVSFTLDTTQAQGTIEVP